MQTIINTLLILKEGRNNQGNSLKRLLCVQTKPQDSGKGLPTPPQTQDFAMSENLAFV